MFQCMCDNSVFVADTDVTGREIGMIYSGSFSSESLSAA